MKSITKSIVVLSLLTGFFSCNKTYSCECFTSGKTHSLESNSKQGAITACNEYEVDIFNGNCELR
jgi:hypothetical protein